MNTIRKTAKLALLRGPLMLASCLFIFNAQATEGMWIPALLKAVEGDMQAMGLKLTAEDIYSINRS